MKVFVARQPIYNKDMEIFAYELLYRNDLNNVCTNVDGDQATAEVLINSYLNIGLDKLTGGKSCFIHFTENLLEKKLPLFINPNDIVIKISNLVKPSSNLIDICKELHELGYIIEVKESFFFEEEDLNACRILPYISFIRVDFRQGNNPLRTKVEKIALTHNVKLIAEKIETKETYDEAMNNGYHYFQGYFLSKPLIESAFEIPIIFSSTYHEIQKVPLDNLKIDEMTDLLEKDLSLSLKLLKLIHTSSLDKGNKICSIQDAISLLGVEVVYNWIKLIAFVTPSNNSEELLSNKLVRLALTRAKLCQAIAKQIDCKNEEEYYMTGLFSLMKEIVDGSLKDILDTLPLQENIYDALLGKENIFKEVLDLAEAVEHARWIEINEKCKQLNIRERELFRIYAESVNWATKLLQTELETIKDQRQIILN